MLNCKGNLQRCRIKSRCVNILIKDLVKLPDALEKAFDFGGVRTMAERIADGEHLIGGSAQRAAEEAFKQSKHIGTFTDVARLNHGI